MKMTSLKQKLIFHNTATLSVLFLFVMFFFLLVSYRSYQRQLKETKAIIKKDLLVKGQSFISNTGFLLREYVADNAVNSVKEMARRTVAENDDIIYGGYVVKDDLQPWCWVTPENPSGKIEEKTEIRSPTTEWAMQLREAAYRETRYRDQFVYEFAAPVYLRMDEDLEDSPEFMAGAVIFAFSDRHQQAEIAKVEAGYASQLLATLIVLGLLGVATISLGYAATRSQAIKITQPIAVLTSAADTIAAGNYSIEVELASGDEIENLASSFNKMARDLDNSYATLSSKNEELQQTQAELENFNKHLEEMVEERTSQLRDSETKFRALFEESADAILLATQDHFLDGNRAMLDLFGCRDKEELRGLEPIQISPTTQPDGRPSEPYLNEVYANTLTVGSQYLEWVNQRLDGTLFHTEIVMTSFPLNGSQVFHIVFRDITERKETERALREAQQQLVETAHHAGMAEIATGILHNIGNILNSVNISTEEVGLTLKNSKVRWFIRAAKMMERNRDQLAVFLTHDEKGKLIPEYFINLAEALSEENRLMSDEILALTNKIGIMRDVISTQQNYAKASLYTQNVLISDVIEDALKLQAASLSRLGVQVVRRFLDQPLGSVAKVKLVHVLTNLFKNAREAMQEIEEVDALKVLTINLTQKDEHHAEIRIQDTGYGIEEKNFDKIFNHGFTTKSWGHGFGLHTCANFMTEMGGSLNVESSGKGKGATFVLVLPLDHGENPPGFGGFDPPATDPNAPLRVSQTDSEGENSDLLGLS